MLENIRSYFGRKNIQYKQLISMVNIALISSMLFYLFVMRIERISPVSLYGIFGLQWFYYWIFTYLVGNNILPAAEYIINKDYSTVALFSLFNAIALFCFSLAYLIFYRKDRDETARRLTQKNDRYRLPLAIILFVMCIVLIVLSLRFPYLKYNWIAHSINANMRNVFVGLFIFYMLIEKRRLNVFLLFFLFAISTVIWGGRLYLAILTASLVFYYYQQGIFNFRQLVVFLLLAILGFSFIGLTRAGYKTFNGPNIMRPIVLESIYSAHPGLALTKLWVENKIKYYTYFGSYTIDPVIMFVPQFVFKEEGVAKEGLNVLSAWENAHGGRNKISPQGAYYYLAEAMEAAGVFGIILVPFGYAAMCILFEKKKNRSLLWNIAYYSFVGTFGFGFVKNQFSWCARYFLQNIFAILIFIAIFSVFWGGAAINKQRKASMGNG